MQRDGVLLKIKRHQSVEFPFHLPLFHQFEKVVMLALVFSIGFVVELDDRTTSSSLSRETLHLSPSAQRLFFFLSLAVEEQLSLSHLAVERLHADLCLFRLNRIRIIFALPPLWFTELNRFLSLTVVGAKVFWK